MTKMRTWFGVPSRLRYLMAIDWVYFVQDVDKRFFGLVLRNGWILLYLAFQVCVDAALCMRFEGNGFAWLEN